MTLRSINLVLSALALPSLLASCGGSLPEADDRGSCQEMVEHLDACGVVAAPTNCDEDVAEEILGKSCEQLSDPGKADFAGALLCHIGVLSACDVPACEPADDSPVLSASCADYTALDSCGSCDYYLCKDAQTGADGCGDDGYLVGFGFKYCERFSQVTRAEMSNAGQRWLDATRTCLQQSIDQGVDPDEASCEAIEQVAYATHPACYVDNGFCDLPISDILKVASTVDRDDLAYKEILRTGVACLERVFDAQTLELRADAELQLRAH